MGRTEWELEPDEAIDVVERRSEFLNTLAGGAKHNPELQEELNLSRSTVYKALRELENLAIIKRTREGYELTLTGRLLLEEYEQFLIRVQNICILEGSLSALPTDLEITADVFNGAQTIFAKPHAPNQPIYSFEELVRSATVLKGTSSVVLPHSVEIVHDQTVAGELEVELILERPVIEYLASDFEKQFQEAIKTGKVTVREVEEPLHYGLVIVEEPIKKVGIVTYGPKGEFQCLIISDSQHALEWTETAWERHRRKSIPFKPECLFDDTELD